MRLRGSDEKELELTILGYAFPEIKNDYSDANWLKIRLRAKDSRRSWERTGHFSLTFEVGQLSIWLDAVAVEAPMIDLKTLKESGRDHSRGFPDLRLHDSMEFTEPNLRFVLFEYTPDGATVRVYFELEARPPWAPASVAGMEDVWLDLEVSAADLKTAVLSLRSELSIFPVRAAH